jgi:hypothetical protein
MDGNEEDLLELAKLKREIALLKQEEVEKKSQKKRRNVLHLTTRCFFDSIRHVF